MLGAEGYYRRMASLWETDYPSVRTVAEVEQFYEEEGYPTTFAHLLDQILGDCADGGALKRVLEFGCDNGVMLNFFRDRGCELYGVDINDRALREGRQLFPDLNLVRSFELEIPFRDGYFDLVFASSVLKHIRHADRDVLYAELRRVARLALVSEVNASTDHTEKMGRFTFYRSDFKAELGARFQCLETIDVADSFLALYRLR